MYACLAVTCHLHFWQSDRGLLRPTAVTRGWNGYQNKSQHRKLTLEKKILPPLLQGFEPATFRSRIWCFNHWAIPAPMRVYPEPNSYLWKVQDKVAGTDLCQAPVSCCFEVFLFAMTFPARGVLKLAVCLASDWKTKDVSFSRPATSTWCRLPCQPSLPKRRSAHPATPESSQWAPLGPHSSQACWEMCVRWRWSRRQESATPPRRIWTASPTKQVGVVWRFLHFFFLSSVATFPGWVKSVGYLQTASPHLFGGFVWPAFSFLPAVCFDSHLHVVGFPV